MLNFITIEVRKLLVGGKISIKNLYDLDAKVQLEVYLREKKAAI
jgi:hypothetical protein